ncbi:glutamate-5-semialdehyde dehydrogenase [Olivibacter domesticus]|uniref:Gamma-glutamyl phosphate reductase n=1 Tax=Olivibacter domesticus TaxID=407022 RepID=A0A1H7IUX6_OLID1|nr:glutamate-5-semialdehyde dehydrogenase [Olivibacter domesticus]SEK65450.1 glutamate-5-semialdehyde dehydrogenase [Olivibacter domesticus]
MNYLHFFEDAKSAQQTMLALSKQTINQVLTDLAKEIRQQAPNLVEENQKDLNKMSLDDPKYDRLKLTIDRVDSIANDIESVVQLDNPIGSIIENRILENKLRLSKIRVPLGVVSVIYEARPNVTLDVFSLCFKTGNVTVLKGGSDAEFSNLAIVKIIHQTLKKFNIAPSVAVLLPSERAATEALLNAVGYIDVLIPRGSHQLISYVRSASKIPVIETGAGIVHAYFDKSGDVNKGKNIIENAKTRRVSVCNALDCLLIHQERLLDLGALTKPLADKDVVIFADEASHKILSGSYPSSLLKTADESHYGTEFLSLKMSIKTVSNLQEALTHISRYSSKHSEVIIAEDKEAIEIFMNQVDAAAVYANASTAFTDGAQFGLGAEIGISTQKLHARGPMGLQELTSYKWTIKGEGQTRE